MEFELLSELYEFLSELDEAREVFIYNLNEKYQLSFVEILHEEVEDLYYQGTVSSYIKGHAKSFSMKR